MTPEEAKAIAAIIAAAAQGVDSGKTISSDAIKLTTTSATK